MQKVVNIIAISSGVVSLAVVGSGVYVYLQRDQLVDNVKSQVMDSVAGALGPAVGGALPDVTGPAKAPAASQAAPAAGLGLPQ